MRRIDIISAIFAVLSILCLIGCFIANDFHLTIVVWILAILGILMSIVVILDALDRVYLAFYSFTQHLLNQSNHHSY